VKRNGSFSNYCVLAAERIHYWLGRDKDHLFPQLLSKLSCSDLINIHKCDLVKVPKIPSQVEQLPIYGFQIRKQAPHKQNLDSVRKEKIDLHADRSGPSSQINRSALQTQCCVNQKTPYIHFEEAFASTDLSSNRVINWRLKEHFLAARKLRNIHKKQHHQQKHHDFVALNPIKKEPQPNSDHEFWEEMIRSKEKPIFQKVTIN